MAERTAAAAWQRFGARELRRVALWSFAAAGSWLLATYTANTDAGRSRWALAMGKIHGEPEIRQADSEPDDSARKLADALQSLQSLAADRDRLAARLDSLEHNVSEITGSIAQRAAAPITAQPAPKPPFPTLAAPEVAPTAPSSILTVPPEPSRQEFGIDLGGAANVERLRALWIRAKTKHGGLLEGLRPIVAIREHVRPRGTELRLVVGPFANAAAAARLCSVIAVSGAICQPAIFEGQQLASH